MRVPWVETDIKIESGISKIEALHPPLVHPERKVQKPYFCHQIWCSL